MAVEGTNAGTAHGAAVLTLSWKFWATENARVRASASSRVSIVSPTIRQTNCKASKGAALAVVDTQQQKKVVVVVVVVVGPPWDRDHVQFDPVGLRHLGLPEGQGGGLLEDASVRSVAPVLLLLAFGILPRGLVLRRARHLCRLRRAVGHDGLGSGLHGVALGDLLGRVCSGTSEWTNGGAASVFETWALWWPFCHTALCFCHTAPHGVTGIWAIQDRANQAPCHGPCQERDVTLAIFQVKLMRTTAVSQRMDQPSRWTPM